MKSPRDEICDVLKKCKRGDILKVYFQDACDFQGFFVPEEAVAKAVLDDTGEFEKVVEKDGVFILVLVTGSVKTQGHLIPVGSIYRVEVLRNKRVKKRKKGIIEQPAGQQIIHNHYVIVKPIDG